MLLLFSIRVAKWPPDWEKSCSFGLLYVSFVNVYRILCVPFFPVWFWGWDVRCDCINFWSLSFYLLFMSDAYCEMTLVSVAIGRRKQLAVNRTNFAVGNTRWIVDRNPIFIGAPVAHWVKRWPADLAVLGSSTYSGGDLYNYYPPNQQLFPKQASTKLLLRNKIN